MQYLRKSKRFGFFPNCDSLPSSNVQYTVRGAVHKHVFPPPCTYPEKTGMCRADVRAANLFESNSFPAFKKSFPSRFFLGVLRALNDHRVWLAPALTLPGPRVLAAGDQVKQVSPRLSECITSALHIIIT